MSWYPYVSCLHSRKEVLKNKYERCECYFFFFFHNPLLSGIYYVFTQSLTKQTFGSDRSEHHPGQSEAKAGWLAQGLVNSRLGCTFKSIKNFDLHGWFSWAINKVMAKVSYTLLHLWRLAWRSFPLGSYSRNVGWKLDVFRRLCCWLWWTTTFKQNSNSMYICYPKHELICYTTAKNVPYQAVTMIGMFVASDDGS